MKAAGVRLFIALWPPAQVQDALFAEGARFAGLGRRMPARNLHVTLAFLGQVGTEKVEVLSALLRELRFASCSLTLDRLGYFAGSRALWAGCSSVPAEVVMLQRRVVDALAKQGFPNEDRPFRLHVSLLRDAAKPPAADLNTAFSIPWLAGTVALVRSDLTSNGARYTVLSETAPPVAG